MKKSNKINKRLNKLASNFQIQKVRELLDQFDENIGVYSSILDEKGLLSSDDVAIIFDRIDAGMSELNDALDDLENIDE